MLRSRPIIWLLLLVLGFPIRGLSQWVFTKNLSVPVSVNGQPLANAWMGGLNCPQFCSIDLDNDGREDLVVFDRGYFDADSIHNGHKLLTFLNTGSPGHVSYTFAPQYESWFPPISYWMKLEDFNCDGVKDILTCSPGKIILWMGTRSGNGQLSFTYRGELDFTLAGFSNPLNIYVSTTDIPGIADVDGDGDLDIVTFESLASYNVIWYKNLSEELTHTCGDTLAFIEADSCWGRFLQDGAESAAVLDTCVTGIPKTAGQRHSGDCELLLHLNGEQDSLMDVLISDINYNNINMLVNGGSRSTAKMVAQDSIFPFYDVPINIPVFPATFFIDIDNDGKKDLIAAPNMPRASLNLNCAWYYKNISTSDTVKLQFQTDTFLVNTGLDFGEGANPAFFDYNGDGLMDVVVGNLGYYDSVGRYRGALALLKNVGTLSSPAFELVERDYAGLSQLRDNNRPLLGLTPTFGDMDGDGDLDMIVGDTSGKLHYFRNDPVNHVANFTLVDSNYFGIDAGNFSAPFIYDVNGDGLPDLVVGRFSGNVYYYENHGNRTSAQFDQLPTNNFFGQLDARIPGFLDGYSSPVITRLDSSNDLYLLSGNEEGRIIGYLVNPDSINSGAFKKVFDFYSGIDEGERSTLTVADIDSDGKMEMVLGNYRGGLSFFKQIDSLETKLGIQNLPIVTAAFTLSPNPTNGQLNIRSENPLPQGAVITIIDLLGRTLVAQTIPSLQTNQIVTLNLNNLSQGFYICTVKTQQGISAYPFSKM